MEAAVQVFLKGADGEAIECANVMALGKDKKPYGGQEVLRGIYQLPIPLEEEDKLYTFYVTSKKYIFACEKLIRFNSLITVKMPAPILRLINYR